MPWKQSIFQYFHASFPVWSELGRAKALQSTAQIGSWNVWLPKFTRLGIELRILQELHEILSSSEGIFEDVYESRPIII